MVVVNDIYDVGTNMNLKFLPSQLKVRTYHVTLLIKTLAIIVQLSLHSTTSTFVTQVHASALLSFFYYCFFSFLLLIYRTTMTRNCHLLSHANPTRRFSFFFFAPCHVTTNVRQRQTTTPSRKHATCSCMQTRGGLVYFFCMLPRHKHVRQQQTTSSCKHATSSCMQTRRGGLVFLFACCHVTTMYDNDNRPLSLACGNHDNDERPLSLVCK